MIDRANGKRIEQRIKRLVAEGKIATAQVDTHAERRDVKQARPARVGSAVREANAPKGVGPCPMK